MDTIKLYLKESGSIAELDIDFRLYKDSYNTVNINLYVPKSLLLDEDEQHPISVKIGMLVTTANGDTKTTFSYNVPLIMEDVEVKDVRYNVYGRPLPDVFLKESGNQVLVANIVKIDATDSENIIVDQIITTQTTILAILESDYIENEETEEEPITPTELEYLTGLINLKQNKVDEALRTESKNVVGAINEVYDTSSTNSMIIDSNTEDISQIRGRLDLLEQNISLGEDYIGQLTGETIPTDTELDDFVQSVTGRATKNGDVILFVLQIENETDKIYKYTYTNTGWRSYQIPSVELASNGDAGLIKGTYNTGSTNNVLFDISGGEIVNVYVKRNGIYTPLNTIVENFDINFNDLYSGLTPVGASQKAINDGLNRNIVNTYLTQTAGATKQYVKDYSMPRIFNDVYFIRDIGYTKIVPVSETGIQFEVNSNNVGDVTLFQLEQENNADFELSVKNGYSNTIYIGTNVDSRIALRLTTEYKKGDDAWKLLNVEVTSPIQFVGGEIEKVSFGNPFTSLGVEVITLTNGDKLRQTLEAIVQTSSPITFTVYSNEVYPSTFNLTSQSYVMSDVEDIVGRLIEVGANGEIVNDEVVLTIQDEESYLPYKTNNREFLLNGNITTAQELDLTLPVKINFGGTTYNLLSYLTGLTPLTIGDLSSSMFTSTTGYSFVAKVIYHETSDYTGFVLSPRIITANELIKVIEDSDTIIVSTDSTGTKVQLQLSATQLNRLMRALVTPMSTPSGVEIVAIDNTNSQVNLELGDGLQIINGKLAVTGGAGGTSDYTQLTNKPTLNTDNTTSQTANANETINGTINLHKISKTGLLADAIDDSSHRLVSDTEKNDWNNKVSKVTQEYQLYGTGDPGQQTTYRTGVVNITDETTEIVPDIIPIFTGGQSTVNVPQGDYNIANKKYVDDEISKLASLPIGSIITSAIPLTDARYHLLDGTTIAQDGIYADFVTLLKTLVASGYNLTCTQSEFETDIGNTGNCGKFVIDDTNNLVRLPKITRFIQGLSDLTNIGTSLSAGLPNITGNFKMVSGSDTTASGAFTKSGSDTGPSGTGGWTQKTVYLNASRSSSIYGNNATVQPEATQYPYYIVLASGYKSDIEVNIDNVVTDLNDKLGKTDVSRYPIETWKSSDGGTWYTIYNDGFKECGGIASTSTSGKTTLQLPVIFSNNQYLMLTNSTVAETGSSFWWSFVYSKTVSSAVVWHGWKGINASNGGLSTPQLNFYCKGY